MSVPTRVIFLRGALHSNQHCAASDRSDAGGVRSYAGVNFVFVDGHVTFLPATLDKKTYLALATRAGGETISGGY